MRKARQILTELHAALSEIAGEGNVELKENDFGDLYLSLPRTQSEALEIESLEMPTGVYISFTRRGWDRTGGMSFEEEVGEVKHQHLAVGLVKAELELWAKIHEQEVADEAFFG